MGGYIKLILRNDYSSGSSSLNAFHLLSLSISLHIILFSSFYFLLFLVFWNVKTVPVINYIGSMK